MERPQGSLAQTDRRVVTPTHGPLLPFTSTSGCCSAARQTGLSLRARNLGSCELTDCGTKRPVTNGDQMTALAQKTKQLFRS